MGWMLDKQASSGKNIAAQRRRVEKLGREQQKLTQAYLADALPLEALKREQERVGRELIEARALIEQYQTDYESIEAALDHALMLCRYGSLAYEHAEPEVRRMFLQAAFDKLWIIGDEIVGCDLKPGYVTLLDDELIATLDQEAHEHGDSTGEPGEDETYYRRTGDGREHVGTLDGGQWLTIERPRGPLPWEAKNPASPGVRRGSNVDNLVGATGFEPVTPRL